MADRHAINDLFSTYAWANDTRDAALVGEVFTDEPTFDLAVRGETAVGPLSTKQELVEFFGGAFGEQSDTRRHVTTNLRYVEESDDAAHVTAYLSLLVTDDGVLDPKCTGIYDARVVREGDRWRFSAMSIQLDGAF